MSVSHFAPEENLNAKLCHDDDFEAEFCKVYFFSKRGNLLTKFLASVLGQKSQKILWTNMTKNASKELNLVFQELSS